VTFDLPSTDPAILSVSLEGLTPVIMHIQQIPSFSFILGRKEEEAEDQVSQFF
jgi:hypothetical protein